MTSDTCPSCGNGFDFGTFGPVLTVPQGCRVVDLTLRVLCDGCGLLLVKEMSPRDREPSRD